MRSSVLKAITLLIAVLLIAAACGDDQSILDGAGTVASTAADGAGVTTTAAADGGDGTPTAGGDITDLYAQYQTMALRTTYLSGPDPDPEIVTFSQDPNQDPPVAAMIMEGGKAITRGDELIWCDESMCMSYPGGMGETFIQAFMNPMLYSLLAVEDLDQLPGFQVEQGTTVIAGRNGICTSFTATAALGGGGESARWCIDSELGFTLLIEKRDPGGDWERLMELIEFGAPQPDDFEPTGPVTPMPGG
jgi:hypothetical protein